MKQRVHEIKLANFRRFLDKNKIGVNQLARAVDRSPNTIVNMMQRPQLSPDLQMDIETVLTRAGLKLPKNIWTDIEGNKLGIERRTLRDLHSSDVITVKPNEALSRERRLIKYLSPLQLDPRKESLKLQPLTINARRRFGLIADPFRAELHAIDDVLLTKEHHDAVEEMLRAAKRQDFIAIIGEVGCGKTTCLEVFQQRLPRNIRLIKCHTLDKGTLTGSNIYDAIIMDIAGELDVKTTIPAQRERKARKVIQLLETLVKQDQGAVIVLDEAHGLAKECLRALKRLHELDRGFQRLLSIILLGQRELIPKLEDPTLREVGQRCARFEFRGLNGKTSSYLEHKITKAGGDFHAIFDTAAVKEIEKVLTHSEGKRKFGPYPLQVNTFVTLAMNIADEFGADKITTDILDEIRPYAAQ